MDSPESERLWREIKVLQERVVRLEARLAQNPPLSGWSPMGDHAAASPETPVTAEAAPALSFVQPERASLESRIGSQWFNRVGIIAVLVGAAWFLKYAVDQRWLGDLARVLIGAVAGLGLIGWSEQFRRRSYPVFSFSLKAVGTGLLYLVLWASFSLFHMVSYPVAFLGMVVVTAGNGWLCWVQRSEVLAAYAAIGGFLTPALLAQDHTSVFTLGSYLLLLNAGLFALLAAGRWPRLLLAAFAGTSGYMFSLALRASALRLSGEAGSAWLLVGLFFAVFSLAPMLLLQFRDPSGPARGIAVANTVLNAVLGSVELWQLSVPQSFTARWMLVFVALWYAALLALGRLLPVPAGFGTRAENLRLRAPGALFSVHAGLVITLAALGIWSGLGSSRPDGTGGWVVAGWGLEAAVLLLLTLRRRGEPDRVLDSPMPAASLLLSAAVLLLLKSLLKELPQGGLMFLNEQFGLYLLLIVVAVLAVRLGAYQHGRALGTNAEKSPAMREWTLAGNGSAILATVLLLIAGMLENHSYWAAGGSGTAEQFWDSAWATGLGVVLLVLGFRLRWAFLRWQALAVLTLAVAKVFLVDTRSLSQGFRILSFFGLGVLLLLVSFIYQRDLLNLRGKEHS